MKLAPRLLVTLKLAAVLLFSLALFRALPGAGPAGSFPRPGIAEAATCNDPPVSTGLVSRWQANGNASDSVGPNNGGFVGDANASGAGILGSNAFSFDGGGDRVDVPYSGSIAITGTQVTLAGWIFPTADPNGQSVYFGRSISGLNDYTLFELGGVVAASIRSQSFGEAFLYSSFAAPLNTWTHVALVYDGATMTIYVNGSSAATRSQFGNIADSGYPFFMGGRLFDFPSDALSFTGREDEVMLFNEARSAGDISTIYQCQADTDGDGVANAQDQCPNTAPNSAVDANGCTLNLRTIDSDGDGVCNPGGTSALCTGRDNCPNTPRGSAVDSNGCSAAQVDADGDGVCNPGVSSSLCSGSDACPNTPAAERSSVDNRGCGRSAVDADQDGVCTRGMSSSLCTGSDNCPNTPSAERSNVDNNGCGHSEVDHDGDGVCNRGLVSNFCTGSDDCPNTPVAQRNNVNAKGCTNPPV